MMLSRLTRALLGTTVCAAASLLGWAPAAGAAAASSTPSVHVSTSYAAVGQLVQVTGSGWAPVGQTVQIQLCGQDAVNLSTDCDQTHQYTAAIRAGGIFYGALTVQLPPSPCPCVVMVTNEGGVSGVNTPLRILGARSVAVPPRAAPKAPVAVSAKVLAPVSVGAWFGGPKAVTLEVRIKNLSPIAYESPTLSVDVGRGRDPSGFVVGKPLAPLAVGASQVVRIPVTLPAFTFGSYSVRAEVITGQGQAATVVGTSSYPWGIFLAAALVIQAVLLLVRNRVRTRLGRTAAPELPGEQTAGEGGTEPAAVIDLRTPATPRAGAWTTIHRLALLFPEQRRTCSVEVLACPAIRVQRTTVQAWDDFAASPWEALHEGSLWAEMAAESPSNVLVPGEAFRYESGRLALELSMTAVGAELRLGDNRTVVPVRVQGSVTFDGEVAPIDVESVLEQTWGVDSSNRSRSEDSGPPAGSLTYGCADGGDSFYLLLGSGGEAAGWLVREGRASTIVEAVRRVEEQSGPYPGRLTVELSDSLGRRALVRGATSNGMAHREDDILVLDCRTDWDIDGVPAVGEDRSAVDIDAWRGATRAGRGELADTSS